MGDLRPGSISAVVHRCGKSYCHCAKPKDPGHEPQIRVLRKVHGKSVAETLSSPTAFRKAQGEVSEFHRFQELSAELVTINEKICRLRPLEQEPGGWTAEEKNGCCDPSGSRAGNRRAAASDIHRTSQDWRNRPGSGGDGLTSSPAAGRCRGSESTAPDRSPRRNRKDLAPAEGWPAIRGCAPSLCLACWDAQKCGALVTRAPRCQQGGCPTDVALDVKNTELSPGGRRMLTLVGSECSSFARGREQDEAVGRTGNLYQGCRTDYGKHRCGY